MAKLLIDFLTLNRNPNPNSHRYIQNNWNPVQAENFNYLDIDDFPTMKSHLNTERYFFWDQLFPIAANRKSESKNEALDDH